MSSALEFEQWKKDYSQFIKEYCAFKGNKQKRSELFDVRLEELWNRALHNGFRTFQEIIN